MKTARISSELYKGTGWALGYVIGGEVAALEYVDSPTASIPSKQLERVRATGQAVLGERDKYDAGVRVAVGMCSAHEFNYLFTKRERAAIAKQAEANA